MQTFPLELDNALFTFNLFSIYQMFIQLFFFSIKYNKIIYREAIVVTNFKTELRNNIQMVNKNPEIRKLYDIRKLQLSLDMYIMNLVALLVPFIVYCVIMYVYKLNMRDKKMIYLLMILYSYYQHLFI
jgi:hypothetical protein